MQQVVPFLGKLRSLRALCLGLFLGALWGTAPMLVLADEPTSLAELPEVISFNAHIRPLMSNTCFVCHGPAAEENPSELRLDSFEAATGEAPSGEGKALVPGDPENSTVAQRIFSEDPALQMPPEEFRHQLTDRDKAIFRKWIEQGAKYQRHWAYAPLEVPELPQIAARSLESGNEIDAFIAARLAAEGLQPSPSADKATLLRRLSFDLIGLPPTVDEVQAFLTDERPDAYRRQVDRLMASPHYGERMASPWLDIVRFATTVGFHGDQNQRIFSYRDYVIHAFNSNKPFDQFTREQLAGDLLPNPTEEQLTATGFTRLNMMTREGGAQFGEYMAKYNADRVRALGTAWLGSTLGCCECHDHKYDPYSSRDFYSLGAFFADLQQWGVYGSYKYSPNADLKEFNNDSPFPPELLSKSTSLNERIEYLQLESDRRIAAELPAELAESPEFQGWASAMRDFLASHPTGWVAGTLLSVDAEKGSQLERRNDGVLLFRGKPRADEITTLKLRFPTATPLKAIRLEVLPDELHQGFVGRGKMGAFASKSNCSSSEREPQRLRLF